MENNKQTCLTHVYYIVKHIYVSTELNVEGPHYQETLKHIHEQKKAKAF